MAKSKEQEFQDFLLLLDATMAKKMLEDLNDEERRSPQLYNSVSKMLERHNFQITRFNPDEEVMTNLSNALADYDNVVKLAMNE